MSSFGVTKSQGDPSQYMNAGKMRFATEIAVHFKKTVRDRPIPGISNSLRSHRYPIDPMTCSDLKRRCAKDTILAKQISARMFKPFDKERTKCYMVINETTPPALVGGVVK